MNIIRITTPPSPYFFVSGSALYRPGDMHRKRTAIGIFNAIFVEYGELFLTEANRPYHLKQGNMLILGPQNTHYSHKAVTEETLFHWVHFTTSSDYEYTDHIEIKHSNRQPISFFIPPQENIFLPVHKQFDSQNWQAVSRLLKIITTFDIDKYRQSTIYIGEKSKSIIYFQEMFYKLLQLIQLNPPEKKVNSIAKSVMEYLQSNYSNPITLELLSKHFRFHEAHLIRCIKREFSITPIDALNKIRIDRAKQLLQYSEMTNQDIASAIGFNSASYFCRMFKEQTGLTPKEYVKRINNQK